MRCECQHFYLWPHVVLDFRLNGLLIDKSLQYNSPVKCDNELNYFENF